MIARFNYYVQLLFKIINYCSKSDHTYSFVGILDTANYLKLDIIDDRLSTNIKMVSVDQA